MKKIIFIFIILILTFNVCYAESIVFNDLTRSHWAYDAIMDMASKGLVKGYEDKTFKPEKEVTREEFAQLVYNSTKKEASIEQMQNYSDVSSERWSYNAVQLVGNSLKETSDGYVYFYPTKPIERQEVAKILSDFYEYDESDLKSLESIQPSLKDADAIKEEYVSAVTRMYNSGLMKGVTNDEFAPTRSLTRAQAATLIARMTTKQPEEKPDIINNDFDFGFLKLENDKKNIVYSPLSIKYAMKMLSEGANNNTKKEIDALIGNFNLTKYKSIDKVLSLANSIYIKNDYSQYVKEEFINSVNNKYDAEIKYDTFENASNVNDWISTKTFGIIKNMLSDDMFKNPDLVMLLINALAIDMKWNNFKFDNNNGEIFNLEDGSTMIATTMKKKETKNDSFSYYIDDNVTVLTMDLLKYDDVQLEVDAIMPKNDLANYIKNVSANDINDLLSKTINASKTTEGLNISVPRFEFEYDLKLKEDLKKLGMNEAFSKAADFTNMTNNPKGLMVSDALHKANIEFTEEGVKAAAVTVFSMVEKTSISLTQPIDIRINKPFMFLIRDKETNEIWFVGAVYMPSQWEY